VSSYIFSVIAKWLVGHGLATQYYFKSTTSTDCHWCQTACD